MIDYLITTSPCGSQVRLSYKKEIKSKRSGDEVYSTACYLLAILKHVCSKLDRQKVLNLIPFSNKACSKFIFSDLSPGLDQKYTGKYKGTSQV